MKTILLSFLLSLGVVAWAQSPPQPTLPFGITANDIDGHAFSGTTMDTTYNCGGATCAAHDSAGFRSCLTSIAAGDTIVLDAGTTYVGPFTLPVKSNPLGKTSCIVSSNLSLLPVPGNRVSPSDAVNMPQVTGTTTFAAPINSATGADHWRLVGLEIYSSSSYILAPNEGAHSYGFALVDMATTPGCYYCGVDRVYLHGSRTKDANGFDYVSVNHGVYWNKSHHGYMIDSYCDEIHAHVDANCGIVINSTGPFKIVNNYIGAIGEGFMNGGGGWPGDYGFNNDIEIRKNRFVWNEAWYIESESQFDGAAGPWIGKDGYECKSGNRVLVEGNSFENMRESYGSNTHGMAMRITPRAGQDGNGASCTNIWVVNNDYKSVNQITNIAGPDSNCTGSCTDPGQTDTVRINNNRWLARSNLKNGVKDANGNPSQIGLQISFGGWNMAIDHNTGWSEDNTGAYDFSYTSLNGCSDVTGAANQRINWWIYSNVMPAAPWGDCSGTGSTGGGSPYLAVWFNNPTSPDYNARFQGNTIYERSGQGHHTWPATNDVHLSTQPLTFVNFPTNLEQSTPWTTTPDGQKNGYDYASWTAAQSCTVSGQCAGTSMGGPMGVAIGAGVVLGPGVAVR